MKRILYLTFYFRPDLCAGSFRNTPLAKELANQVKDVAEVEVLTTMPNRYSTFTPDAQKLESDGNLTIKRILLPKHKSGMKDQIRSFMHYYREVKKLTKGNKYDLVFASSSRLFTAFLGYRIAKQKGVKYYLDIRDIFLDSIREMISNWFIKSFSLLLLNLVEHSTFKNAAHINLISGGFNSYFEKYTKSGRTNFPNGIDDEFIVTKSIASNSEIKKVLYAGNIGEGQGLHKILPHLANNFNKTHEFHVYGDGGAKNKLVDEIEAKGCSNVFLHEPVDRKTLLEEYSQTDFFLIHLNDFEAYKKVLPSKVFELGAYNKPIIAGVGGFAARFINENIDNVILFEPCNVSECTDKLKEYKYTTIERTEFKQKYLRSNINKELASSIASYL